MSSDPSSSSITAISKDGTILAVHTPSSSSSTTTTKKRLVIRCYDSSINYGTLKFTLSSTTLSSSENDDDKTLIKQLLFVGTTSSEPTHLCASTSTNHILIWDLNRGVLIHTLAPFTTKEAKKRFFVLHSISSDDDDKLYVLLSRKEKAILYEYNVIKGKLERKIKSGSMEDYNDDEECIGSLINFNVAAGAGGDGKTIFGVRHVDQVRIMDWEGNKLKKFSLDDEDDEDDDEGEKKKVESSRGKMEMPLVQFSNDGKLLLTSDASSGQLLILNVEKGKQCGILKLSSSSSEEESIISSVDIVENKEQEKEEGYIIVVTTSSGLVNFFKITLVVPKKKKRKQLIAPIATLKTNEEWKKVDRVHFHSIKPMEKVVLSLLPVGGGKGGTVEMREYEYCNSNKEMMKGDAVIKAKGEESKEKKKRKVDSETSKSNVVVMGPGDVGGEAVSASDITAPPPPKKQKTDDEDSVDDDDFQLPEDEEDDDGAENEKAIGERLALISSALENPSDSEEEEEHAKRKPLSSMPKPTSESISTLLTQALISNDDSQLEIALHVNDVKIIAASITSLQSDRRGGQLLATLLAKLVTRLARTPSRAQMLSEWVKGVLVAIKEYNEKAVGGGEGQEINVVGKLGPLRNLLNERVESFPSLLRLEGRLALLGNR